MQYELPGGIILETAYFGRFARDLPQAVNLNSAPYMFVDKASDQSFAQAYDAIANALRTGGTAPVQPWFENQFPRLAATQNATGATSYIVGKNSAFFTQGNVGNLFLNLNSYLRALGLHAYNNDQAQVEFLRTYIGYSNYKAGVITLTKRMSHGLTVTGNDTLSKAPNPGMSNQNNAGFYSNSFNPSVQYGPSSYDRRHVVNAIYQYDIPVRRHHQHLYTAESTNAARWIELGLRLDFLVSYAAARIRLTPITYLEMPKTYVSEPSECAQAGRIRPCIKSALCRENRSIFLRSTYILFASSFFLVLVTAPAFSDSEAQSPTAELLSEVIRVNTSNPPGNEKSLDDLLAGKFKPLGFEVEIIPTPDPVKAHFVARLKGDGTAKPILLAGHADTVGVEREKWSVDPFAGVIKDGYVYGRGALDFKGGLAVFAEAVMRLARNKVPLRRDVIFLSEADEEGGKYNTMWLSQSHWKEMDCEFALNEGGWIMEKPDGSVRYVSISTADKSSMTLLLTAHGTSTHSSLPRPDNAIFRLSRAMTKVAEYNTPPRLIPSTREFFETLAKTSEEPMSTYFHNLATSSDSKLLAEADKKISEDTLLHAIMRNTIAPVFLEAGFRGNVIPGSATATLNMRTVPGATAEELIADLKKVIADENVGVALPPANTTAGAQYRKTTANVKPSPTDTALFKALTNSAHKVWPGVPVTTYLFQAGTDAMAWRSRGIPVYGIYPYPISNDDLSRMHGNDERMSVRSLEEGTDMIYQTLLEVAAK